MIRTRRSLARRLAGAATLPMALLGLLAGPVVTTGPAAAAPVNHSVGLTGDGPLKVMPIGDSITWGIGSSTTSSYRPDLYRRLTNAGLKVDFVGSARSGLGPDPDNEGHSGWTISEIAEQLDSWLVTYSPDVVVLHIGTNDLRADSRAAGAPARLSALLDQIHAGVPAAQVFVAKVVGTGNYGDSPVRQRRVNAYNAQVGPVVASKGAQFHLVDQSDVHGIDMQNRLHPNDYGYAKMAWNFYRAMEPVLNTSGAAWPVDRNPYRAATGVRCIGQYNLWYAKYAKGCHVWYQRAAGVWQLPYTSTVRGRSGAHRVTRWITAP